MMRSRTRLIAVVAMVLVAVFAGISFAAYAHTVSGIYDKIYDDSEQGVNLPDIWVENPTGIWDGQTSDLLCEEIANNWPDSDLILNDCESRIRLDGTMFHGDELVPAVWHGIDEGYVDRVWIPNHNCCSGRLATSDSEIVIDQRVSSGMNVGLGDGITIGAGSGRMNFTVVGIGYHSNHLYFAQEGSLFPAEPGTYATGYLSSAGLERLAGLGEGDSNLLLIDVVGTPRYDLPNTDEVEGEELARVIENIDKIVSDSLDSTAYVYDRSQVSSVELLRLDADGAMQYYVPITGMIAAIAGITIFLSLQRLVQSQAREIAILRTLGIPRTAIIPAYFLMPLVIGAIGSSIGSVLGIYLGAPAMLDIYEDILGIPILETTDISPIVIQIIGVTMVVVLFSGMVPAIQASRLQPLEVLRGQHEIRVSSRRVQEFTSNLPATIGLTIRSSIRKPTRLAFTFLAVGLSMLLFGSTLLMMATMEDMTIGSIEENQNWDVQAMVLPGGDQEVIDWAEDRGGVYERLITFPASSISDSRVISANGMDVLSQNSDSLIVLELKEGRFPERGEQDVEVLIDEGLNYFLGWDVDEIQTLVFGSESIDVKIVGITKGEISRTVYFHRLDLADIVGLDSTAVLIDLPDGVSVDGELGDVSLVVIEKENLVSSFEAILEQQQGFLGAIMFLGILIAMVVLFNTLIINLSERDREIATLRVLGAPIGRLGWMMLGEHLAIGLIGGVLAFMFTLVGTQALLSSFNSWTFYVSISADPVVAMQLIGIVVFISVILTPYGMRRIKKMDLVEKVKDLSQ